MITNNTMNTLLTSPVRTVIAQANYYDASGSLIKIFYHTDALMGVSIEKIGDDTKFFGFGVCQKANITLRDPDRTIDIQAGNYFTIPFGVQGAGGFVTGCRFYVTQVHRDENTNVLSITAYDRLYDTSNYTVADLNLTAPYTIREFVEACVELMGGGGLNLRNIPSDDTSFDLSFENGANLEGTETIREVLNAIAEATQTVYYLYSGNFYVRFVRLDVSGAAAYTIDKENYITLKSGDNRRLARIVSATQLGDNYEASLAVSGTTQYIRDNPFWELRDDIASLVDNALVATGGLTVNQFECNWRGNFLVEIGDKIDLVTKDNGTVSSYLLNDKIEYDGSYKQVSTWKYTEAANESGNPTSLGESLKETFAKVDKVNKQIDLVVSEVGEYSEAISSLEMTTDSITTSVSKMDNNMSDLMTEVSTKVTAEDISFIVQSALEQGTERVTTSTGFTFNEEGLHISKENSEITTSITEDGMTVYRNDDEVLTANNLGVKAEDLHATTFLIVGDNSRFENYGSSRTGCFWIGS